ncbi:DNA-binding protein [Aerococcus urinaehominis]|uniref:UPF0122 protein AWM75_02615 n=1 Tax=Aerococcus urinaehominis TaxID=128944 RepID=A0A0X8FKF8_9LACT|nr:putative DNA-binding protein [Aerococcus urinaehominis]AMB98955.1 DNA-binding protein [Aerococcus urinaehominis]SDM41168.1 hypothetical protein SAMN04487985_11550 [Aerococcus urinaehominis]
MELNKTNEVNMLFDFYAPLLTNKQRDYLDLYFRHDYSLGEIADHFAVSRQAVYDNIQRTEKTLLKYEDKLGLAKSYYQRLAIIDCLKHYSDQHPDPELRELLEQLINLDN